MSCTLGKTMVSVEFSADRKKLVLTDTEGRTYTFKHDPRCKGSGIIYAIEGDLMKIIGTELSTTTLKVDSYGYGWCFYSREDDELLASVWWTGEPGGYYGEDY